LEMGIFRGEKVLFFRRDLPQGKVESVEPLCKVQRKMISIIGSAETPDAQRKVEWLIL